MKPMRPVQEIYMKTIHFLLRLRPLHAAATLFAAILFPILPVAVLAQTSSYVQTNIVSDGSVTAQQTDSNMLNPWGIALGKAFWIDGEASGFSLVDSAAGVKQFNVTVPPASSSATKGSPTGVVINTDTTLFPITGGSANFIFATRDGSIAAWNTTTNPNAVTVVNNSSKGAGYTGIATDKNSTATYLLAANFNLGTIDIFDGSFNPTTLQGNFTDPQIPSGFSPFSVHVLNGKVYVAYAQISAQKKQVVGAGLGFVDVYDLDGNLVQEAIVQGSLNAPWGVAIAPAGFGSFGGDLLVGNFGDGVINAFDPNTFALKGSLQNAQDMPIANTGLWEIVFGSATLGDPNTLYFAAGIGGGKDGLFGSITVAPPPPASPDFTVQSSASTLDVTNAKAATATIALAPENGFSGAISLSCSGLPANATCSFNPSSVSLTSSGTVNAALSISETSTAAAAFHLNSLGTWGTLLHDHAGEALAFISPFTLLVFGGIRRRSFLVRSSMLVAAVLGLTLTMSGCDSSSRSSATPPPSNPTMAQIMVNATSGTITHSVPVTITLQ
jgi:uncharacterized protein (TIGR03118 family)